MVAALTDNGDVVVFDLEGRVRRRLVAPAAGATPAAAGRGWRPSRPRTLGRDAFAIGAGVLGDDDFNDPYDLDSDVEDPENVFLDESGRRRFPLRRDRPPATGATAVAAGGRSVWIAGPGGLSRFDDDDAIVDSGPGDEPGGTSRTGGGGWGALSASSDGRWVVGARDGWLVRSADGGETFTTLAPLRGLPRRLAISDAGTVFVLAQPGPNGADTPDRTDVVSISSGSTLDVATCGRRAVLLEENRMRVIDPDVAGAVDLDESLPAGIIDERPPEETAGVACAASGDRLVTYGTGLWTLSRGERGWTHRDELPARPIVSVVVVGGSVWAATGAGLWVVPVAPPIEAAAPDGSVDAVPQPSALTPAMTTSSLSPLESRATWWAAALPQIDIGFAAARATDRREIRAFVLLTFMLDGERGWVRERRRLAFEDARWRRASLGMLASLAHPPAPGSAPLDDEERAALAHVLESAP